MIMGHKVTGKMAKQYEMGWLMHWSWKIPERREDWNVLCKHGNMFRYARYKLVGICTYKVYPNQYIIHH